ncbi:MAG: hypothetical protein M1839_000122 [Geoglossum umbratile]|nr:MAG: hypothetical protein M1839_000122 [Geoglossum umbratile]
MPAHRVRLPPAAKPTRNVFDPWNASLTGHQRGENPIGHSLGWRAARTRRLQGQYRGEDGGEGKEKDGRERSVKDMLLEQGAAKKKVEVEGGEVPTASTLSTTISTTKPEEFPPNQGLPSPPPPTDPPKPKQIFRNLTIHISGSTAPLISDHRLKQLLASHGARIALAPARRTVTHVVLGQPNKAGQGSGSGAGGGLAAGKMQREITRLRGGDMECGVRFVGVKWALDSIKAGKRLSEAAYSPMKFAAKRQRSVYGIFNVTKKNIAAAASGLKGREGGADAVLEREKGNDGDDGEGKENSQPSPLSLA